MKYNALATCLFAASLAPCGAVAVANYDFTVVDDPNEATATFLSISIDINGGSIASDITSPSTSNGGIPNPEFGDVFDNAGNQTMGFSARSNNPASSYSILGPTSTYFFFEVTAGAGASIDFTMLSVLTGVTSALPDTTAFDYTLSYSTDGSTFVPAATIVAGVNPGKAATVTGSGIATATISYDLSGVGDLQGVAGTAYFQLDPVAAGAQNGVITQRGGFIDDLVVSATVVPEPSVSLFGLVGMCFLLHRRR